MILHPHQNESFGYIMAAAGPDPPEAGLGYCFVVEMICPC